MQVEFLDSATGCAIQPESVVVQPHEPGEPAQEWGRAVRAGGRATLQLAEGRHTITALGADHCPMSGSVQVRAGETRHLRFLLDPLTPPRELESSYITALQRDGFTLVQGFVVEAESGAALQGVRVSSSPSGVTTESDSRGFFQCYLPVPSTDGAASSLSFDKAGYGGQDRLYLELWSGGDWTYKIRLQRGGGREVVDERTLRRRGASNGVSAGKPSQATALSNKTAEPQVAEARSTTPLLDPGSGPLSTASSNATVRVPRNIRVLLSDNVTVEYVTLSYYCKHVVPAEWYSSWGSHGGGSGSNCLNAAAIAVRCYATAKINGVTSTSTYDICATSSCQVYGTSTSAAVNTAVDYTQDYVVVNTSAAIASTEYSAENNQLGYTCGDGFTAPTGGCLYDPVCAGEPKNGHGRGLCQWGSARWASGENMAGPSNSDTSPNGFPKRDWKWIVQHYYPTLTLVKGAPLVIGDDVKALKTLDVRACGSGDISSGVNCPLVATKAAGATGVILAGPTVVTNDTKGFTWYQVQWSDTTVGWSAENFLERVFAAPSAPSSLAAVAPATNQINLSWTDTSSVESGVEVERAPASVGPWLQIADLPAGTTAYADKKLFPGSKWYYRVRAYNAAGLSAYTSVANATTLDLAPSLGSLPDRTVTEGTPLTFTVAATSPDRVQLLTDYEPFMSETANGVVLFRTPRFSSSTSAFLDSAPDIAAVTDAYPTTGHGTGMVQYVTCNFTNPSSPWLRLTTSAAATLPNPVININAKLRFDIYADHPVKVAVGCREITAAGGTAIGSDGGTAGAIEWAGVTNISGTAPMPTRSVPASNWTTLTFNFPTEPIRSFSSGNGVLSTASGLGVLEHVAIVPASTGLHQLYLDNFAVLTPRTLTYSLASGAPPGAAIDPTTGAFSWIPTEAQGPATNTIQVIISDDSVPALKATNTFKVVVLESNQPPVLTAIADRTVHAGTTVVVTNSYTDPDLPANAVSFSLDPCFPAGALIDPTAGSLTWTTMDADANSARALSVRATDNGNPPLSDVKSFTVTVVPRPTLSAAFVSNGSLTLNWDGFTGANYRVEYKDAIEDLAWQPLGADLTATNSAVQFIDPGVGTNAQRFYRVLVLQ